MVYGKDMLIKDMNTYTAAKVCANMFHDGAADAPPIFPPYQIFDLGGLRVGFVGYNDPLTPIRQSPAYSRGIKFTRPERDLANYVNVLRREQRCQVVFVLSHMGLAQQLNLSNQPYAHGVDYILGADTHERIREPLQGKFCKITEPGAFALFRRQARSGHRERHDQGRDIRAARRRPGALRRRRGDEDAGRGGARAVPQGDRAKSSARRGRRSCATT